MTVPQADAPQASPSPQVSKMEKSEVFDSSGASSRAGNDLSPNLQQLPTPAKGMAQQDSKNSGADGKSSSVRAANSKFRSGKRGNGLSVKTQGDHTAPASAAMVGASPSTSVMPGMMGYYPYGQQMYYYVPMPAYGGKSGRPEAAAGAAQAMPPGMLSYPYSPYTSVRLAGNGSGMPPASRRPVNHGWGGVPLGSGAASSGPFSAHQRPPSTLTSPLGVAMYRSGQRSMGAARTMPLPPKKTTSTDSSAAPASPAQADYPTRALASSSLSSGSSTDGETVTRRSGSAASSSTDGIGAGVVGGEGEDAGGCCLSSCEGSAIEGGEEVGPGRSSPGSSSIRSQRGAGGGKEVGQGQQQQQQQGEGEGGGGGGSERQPCAFFLKTGTCAYGDRCKFEHPYEQAPHVEFNSLGLPLRPAEPECSYYIKYRSCGFGHTCKFHHPEVDEIELAARAGAAPAAFALQYMQYGAHPMAMPPYSAAYPGMAIQGAPPSGYLPQHMTMGSVMYPGAPPSQARPPLPFPT